MSKPSQEESASLLMASPALGFPSNDAKAPREWRGKWYAVCGDCSAPDVVSCLLAWKMPFIAWSWNQSRAMGMSFFREMARFVLITFGVFALMHVTSCGVMIAMCPEGRDMVNGPHGDWHHDGPMHDHDGPMHDRDGPMHGGPMHDGPMHDGPMFGDDGPEGPHGIPKECIARVAPAIIALAAIGLTLFVYVTLFFARRRTAMRETFGIDGTPKEDCLLYAFCAPCALAQETRTLMHEQVHGGVWYGALPGVVAAPIAAPAPQKMMV